MCFYSLPIFSESLEHIHKTTLKSFVGIISELLSVDLFFLIRVLEYFSMYNKLYAHSLPLLIAHRISVRPWIQTNVFIVLCFCSTIGLHRYSSWWDFVCLLFVLFFVFWVFSFYVTYFSVS